MTGIYVASKVDLAATIAPNNDSTFLERLIENAFSWAMRSPNYLSPKYAERLVAETRRGMKPEQAAIWRADAPEIAARKASKDDGSA